MTENIITSLEALTNVLIQAKDNKLGGTFCSVYYTTSLKNRLNKLPKGMSATKANREAYGIDPSTFSKMAKMQWHFSSSYDKAMSKALGTEYHAEDENSVHIIPNVLKKLLSTNKTYLIVLPTETSNIAYFENGKQMTDIHKLSRYWKELKETTIEYRIVSVSNINKLCIGNKVYLVNITE